MSSELISEPLTKVLKIQYGGLQEPQPFLFQVLKCNNSILEVLDFNLFKTFIKTKSIVCLSKNIVEHKTQSHNKNQDKSFDGKKCTSKKCFNKLFKSLVKPGDTIGLLYGNNLTSIFYKFVGYNDKMIAVCDITNDDEKSSSTQVKVETKVEAKIKTWIKLSRIHSLSLPGSSLSEEADTFVKNDMVNERYIFTKNDTILPDKFDLETIQGDFLAYNGSSQLHFFIESKDMEITLEDKVLKIIIGYSILKRKGLVKGAGVIVNFNNPLKYDDFNAHASFLAFEPNDV